MCHILRLAARPTAGAGRGEEAVDEGEGEGEEVPEHEARRRRGLTASASRVQKLRAREKANPFGVLPVVYLTDLYSRAVRSGGAVGRCGRAVRCLWHDGVDGRWPGGVWWLVGVR